MTARYTTSGGVEVYVSPMLAYPDGMLMAAELAAVAFPAVGALPPGSLDMIKAAAADGSKEALMVALMSLLAPDPAKGEASAGGLFDGIGKMLLSLTDRARFKRLSGDLLRTLTVEHNKQMIELKGEKEVQAVTGANLRLVLELIGIAVRGNLASFTSGAGGTSDASATG